MSDVSQGPGWWMASDEKWYPPELYPTDWVAPADAPEVEVPEVEVPEVEVPEVEVVEVEVVEVPEVEVPEVEVVEVEVVEVPEVEVPEVEVPEVAVAEAPEVEVPEVEVPEVAVAEAPEVEVPEVEVPETADALVAEPPAYPLPADSAPPDVSVSKHVAKPPVSEVTAFTTSPVAEPDDTIIAVPIARPPALPDVEPIPSAPPAPDTDAPDPPSVESGHASTLAVPIVDTTQAEPVVPDGWLSDDSPTAGDGIVGIGGVAMIVGSLLEWAAPSVDVSADVPGQLASLGVPPESPIQLETIGALSSQSNSVALLVAGIVAVACAVLLFRGIVHSGAMLGAVAAGSAGVGLGVFSFLDLNDLNITVNGQELLGISYEIGLGLWLAIAGGVVVVIGGILALRS